MKVNVCNIFTAMPNLLQRIKGSLKQHFLISYQSIKRWNQEILINFCICMLASFLKDPFYSKVSHFRNLAKCEVFCGTGRSNFGMLPLKVWFDLVSLESPKIWKKIICDFLSKANIIQIY